MKRTEYNPKEAARKLLGRLIPADIADKAECERVLKVANIKLTPIMLGKLRKELQNGNGNGHTNEGDLLKRISVVSKAVKSVGGLENLKATIAVIEKVRAL